MPRKKSIGAIGTYVRIGGKTIKVTKKNHAYVKAEVQKAEKALKQSLKAYRELSAQKTRERKAKRIKEKQRLKAYRELSAQKTRERKVIRIKKKQEEKLFRKMKRDEPNRPDYEIKNQIQSTSKEMDQRIENMQHGEIIGNLKDINLLNDEFHRIFNSLQSSPLKKVIAQTAKDFLPPKDLTIHDIYTYNYDDMLETSKNIYKMLKSCVNRLLYLLTTEYKTAQPSEQEIIKKYIQEFEHLSSAIEESATEYKRTIHEVEVKNEPTPPDVDLSELEKEHGRY